MYLVSEINSMHKLLTKYQRSREHKMSKKYIDTQFSNYGFFLIDFTEEELDPIRLEVEEMVSTGFNNSTPSNEFLVGQIEKEFKLTKSVKYLETLILPFITKYEERYEYLKNYFYVLNEDKLIILNEPWVNFQKKTEFNPVHYHNGLFSFVLWLDIPYCIQDEYNCLSSKNSRSPQAGNFQFLYTDIMGRIAAHNIPADKTFNNKMLLFPASLSHAVNPFYTSDKFRVSVSGNFIFDVTKDIYDNFN